MTAAVLAGATSPIPLLLRPRSDARALGIAASAAGIGPLLGLWCETGRVGAQPEVQDLVATHLDHGRRRAARMREELDRLLVPLADRGVEVFVLKGTHTGYRYFPEPGTRPGADIDLLVSREDEPAARVGRSRIHSSVCHRPASEHLDSIRRRGGSVAGACPRGQPVVGRSARVARSHAVSWLDQYARQPEFLGGGGVA